MTFDMARIEQSKREFRERLRALPIAEKLALLDALRERALAIRAARPLINTAASARCLAQAATQSPGRTTEISPG